MDLLPVALANRGEVRPGAKVATEDGKMGERLIRRYEHNHFRGWSVATKRGGKRWAKYFADGLGADGRRASLERAKVFRDELLRMLGPATKIKRRYERSTTGCVGVCLAREVSRFGTVTERFRATWPVVGKAGRGIGGASFAVERWGRTEAKRRAIAARKAGVAAYVAQGGLDGRRRAIGRAEPLARSSRDRG
jgi:hypothetical protein